MAKKFNLERELKKKQQRGIYNPKVKIFSLITLIVLSVGIGITFSVFSYESGNFNAFNSKVSKKVTVSINVANGSTTTPSQKVNSNTEALFTVTPTRGYVFDTVSCTNEQSAFFNEDNNGLSITPTKDTTCTVNFKLSQYLKDIILANELKTTPDFASSPDEANTGMFEAEDDEGTSYYFRGNIENNYIDIGTTYSENVDIYVNGVNGTTGTTFAYEIYDDAVLFCNTDYESDYGYESADACIADIQDYSVHTGDKMLWRVVRINGDGTIRLISDNIVSRKAFNTTHNAHKYVGYTYDNSAPNVQDGTSSTIKAYLDSWYTTNITNKGLDSIIQTSTYCNDTSISKGTSVRHYVDGRMDASTPQLTCNETEQTYGGKYALKVGLLSADELMMAGYTKHKYSTSNTSYIKNPNHFWLGSPASSSGTIQRVFKGFYDGCIATGVHVDNVSGVRPVINLKADIMFSSGNGTKGSPYVVSVSQQVR